MVSIDEMKDCIQEWLAEARSETELARIYAERYHELNIQLDYCMDSLLKQEGK